MSRRLAVRRHAGEDVVGARLGRIVVAEVLRAGGSGRGEHEREGQVAHVSPLRSASADDDSPRRRRRYPPKVPEAASGSSASKRRRSARSPKAPIRARLRSAANGRSTTSRGVGLRPEVGRRQRLAHPVADVEGAAAGRCAHVAHRRLEEVEQHRVGRAGREGRRPAAPCRRRPAASASCRPSGPSASASSRRPSSSGCEPGVLRHGPRLRVGEQRPVAARRSNSPGAISRSESAPAAAGSGSSRASSRALHSVFLRDRARSRGRAAS